MNSGFVKKKRIVNLSKKKFMNSGLYSFKKNIVVYINLGSNKTGKYYAIWL